MAEEPRIDPDAEARRGSELQDRTVLGAAPIQGGPTMVSTGAYDTSGGGDLGGPGPRDPGDSAGDLRPEQAEAFSGPVADAARGDLDRADAEQLAKEVFGSDEDTNSDQLSAAIDRTGDQDG